MIFWIVILLGIVQGATEFLPVSSSGHLVLFYNIFGISDNTLLFSVLLHVATLLAVIYVYWKDLVLLTRHPFCKTNKLIITATIPTVIIALLFKSLIQDSFGGGSLTICFVITGIVLLISDMVNRRHLKRRGGLFDKNMAERDITHLNLSYKQAFAIGVCQGIACFPGISRSGSTIAGGLILGADKNEVADFSFLLSIPIILGSLLLEVVEFIKTPTPLPFSTTSIVISCVFAFVCGLMCIKLLLQMIKKQRLIWFSLYLFMLSAFLLLNKYVLFWF